MKDEVSFGSFDRNRPPMGIMPEWAWRMQRMKELCEAIHRQLSDPSYIPNHNRIAEWSNEIIEHTFYLQVRQEEQEKKAQEERAKTAPPPPPKSSMSMSG